MSNNSGIIQTHKQLSGEVCTDSCESNGMTTDITCKLTKPELRKRKETVLTELKKQVLEKKELPNGFAYRFAGDNQTIDQLTEFIKTERECCDFFTFILTITGDKKTAWLALTGAGKVKSFILSELEL